MDTTYPLSIGGHANSTYVFNGRIDEVSLYKRVLNANERTWLYNAGAGRTYTDLSGTPAMTNTVSYSYDANHAHAVSTLAGNQYQYDANGNMISRHVLEGTTFQDYTLSYDAENRLVQVQKNGSTIASFTFDADGKRVKSVMDGETTLFVGAHYEVKNGNQITQYYLAGTTRVAIRKYTIPQNMSVEYLLSDHPSTSSGRRLGSTSLTTDANGAKVLELRYKAWGEVRATWTANPTTTPAYKSPAYTYTGQYSYSIPFGDMDDPATTAATEGFGLMFYNARWYDPALGRFVQADSVIPFGVQGLDRYAYSNNSPVVYTDPSGHSAWEGDGGDYTWQDIAHDAYIEKRLPIDELERNHAIAETILYGGTEAAVSVLFEPADWGFTIYHCIQGECSVIGLAFMVLPGLSGSAGKLLDDIPWKAVVDPGAEEIVEGAFKEIPKVVELTEDTKVYRYWTEGMREVSYWVSPTRYVRPGNARRFLALPESNLATNVTEFIIPKGTKILIGQAASKVDDFVTFGEHAVGGGIQFYVPILSVFKKVE